MLHSTALNSNLLSLKADTMQNINISKLSLLLYRHIFQNKQTVLNRLLIRHTYLLEVTSLLKPLTLQAPCGGQDW